MPERLERLTIEGFRGVPERWEILFPEGRGLAVLGENGTGKSSIADALEFLFHGSLEYLQREGRRGAVRHLAATVPTRVEAQARGGRTWCRSHPARPSDTPPIPENFLLRGRTLVEFMEMPKGEKWQTLARLLGLGRLDELRLAIQTVRNELDDDEVATAAALSAARRAMGVRRGVADEAAAVFEEVQAACVAAGVAPPATLDAALEPAWVSGALPDTDAARQEIRLADLATRIKALAAPSVGAAPLDTWNATIAQGRAALVTLRTLLEAGQRLIEAPEVDRCPLCLQPINRVELAATIVATLEGLEQSSRELDGLAGGARHEIEALSQAHGLRARIAADADALGVALPAVPENGSTEAFRALGDASSIDVDALRSFTMTLRGWDAAARGATKHLLVGGVRSRADAVVDLGVKLERLRAWREAQAKHRVTALAASRAHRLHDTFAQAEHRAFSEILDQISARVATFYQQLHPAEGVAAVGIEPWGPKGAELSVDFHGTLSRPPHGVLSESHLNSLAIALFLAMAERFNHELGFIVLDDVINSLDAAHRTRLADLLVDEFGGAQLIVLTHDTAFYERLRRAGCAGLELMSWRFAEGPRATHLRSAPLLDAASDLLAAGSTEAAGNATRRALEGFLADAAEALEARVVFRRGISNDRRELKELLDAVRSRLRLVARPLFDELEPILDFLDADVAAVLNPASHAGRGRPSEAEVRETLAKVTLVERRFTCADCGTRVWRRGGPEAGSCKCGRSRFPPPAAPVGADPI